MAYDSLLRKVLGASYAPINQRNRRAVPALRISLPGKVLGGTGILPVRLTGWKPVPPKAAGTEARPTNFIHVLVVSPRLMNDCLEKFKVETSAKAPSPVILRERSD
jgi:hypothetical protein